MNFYVPDRNQNVNLQATLSAASQDTRVYAPHHPITCPGSLRFHEDGTMECDHMRTKPDCPRTQSILDHTISMLLFEEAWKKFGHEPQRSTA